MKRERYVIGVDFGSDTVRSLVVDALTGWEMAASVTAYPPLCGESRCDVRSLEGSHGHRGGRTSHAAGASRETDYMRCGGGTYSCEWVWTKMLHCLRHAPELIGAAYAWSEHCDWVSVWPMYKRRSHRFKAGAISC